MTNPEARASSEMELKATEFNLTVIRMFRTERAKERRMMKDDVKEESKQMLRKT